MLNAHSIFRKYDVKGKVILTFLIVTGLFSIGCLAQDEKKYGYNIDSFREIISLQEAELKRIFENSSIFSDKIPAHDPGTYDSGLGILIGNESVFLRMENNIVKSILFRSPKFVTERGAHVGQSFCDILPLYPKAEFYIGYLDELYLTAKEQGILFDFIAADLPHNKYMKEGLPDRDSPTLCVATLDSIEQF